MSRLLSFLKSLRPLTAIVVFLAAVAIIILILSDAVGDWLNEKVAVAIAAVSLLVAVLAILSMLARWVLLDKSQWAVGISALIVFTLLGFGNFFLDRFGGFELWIFIAPIEFLQSIVVFLAALVLAWGFWGGRIRAVFDLTESKLNDTVSQAFNTDEFLSVLRTTLPSGAKDEKLGLDFIPFMLQRSVEQAASHTQTAQFYLRLLLFSAVTFSGVLLFYGYVLVVDDSVGLGRSANELVGAHRELTSAVQSADPDLRRNADFIRCCQTKIDTLAGESKDESIRSLANSFLSSPSIGNLRTLSTGLSSQLGAPAEVRDLTREVDAFIRDHDRVPANISNLISQSAPLVDALQKAIDTPEAKTADTIKRLAIGVVVASFFLAILGYLSRLHSLERNTAKEYADEELTIRRFYVCLRCAEGDPVILSTVLNTFLSSSEKANAELTLEGGVVSHIGKLEELVKELKKA